MKHDFWHDKWKKNEVGFHLSAANPLLVKHLGVLQLKQGARLFLPLCGKSLDIAWLLTQGYRVVGVELSGIAVNDLFASLGLTPNITKLGQLAHYSALGIDIYVGDIFQLSPSMLDSVDAVYDRAALVALPADMRKLYTEHVMLLTQAAPQLLICLEYDQTLQAGPPFSIDANEVKLHYQASYDLILLSSADVAGGLKGKCSAMERVWYLKPLH